jgi:hypothetical protein
MSNARNINSQDADNARKALTALARLMARQAARETLAPSAHEDSGNYDTVTTNTPITCSSRNDTISYVTDLPEAE